MINQTGTTQTQQTSSKRTLRNPELWVGKRVDLTKWQLPRNADYAICRKTGKLQHMDDLGITFPHHAFDKADLLKYGIYIEDADWLSDEGFDQIMDVLNTTGLITQYWAYYNRGLLQ